MDRFHLHMSRDYDNKVFLSVKLLDIVSFTAVFWLALYWRRKPEFHREAHADRDMRADFGRIC